MASGHAELAVVDDAGEFRPECGLSSGGRLSGSEVGCDDRLGGEDALDLECLCEDVGEFERDAHVVLPDLVVRNSVYG